MASKLDRINKNRLRSSNVTVVISISLVLFLIGIIGMIIINANSYIDYLKEQMVIEVFFKNEKDKKDLVKNEKSQLLYLDTVRTNPYVKSAKYISKKQAVQIAKKDLGVDSEALFEEDIFPASITVALKPEYIDSTHIETIKHQLQKSKIVDEVKSDSQLLSQMNKGVNKITIGISVLAVIILLISVSLINNSIRLKIYSKRFIIKTMQLVGAKRFFIMKPFLGQAIVLGSIGAVIALILLSGVNYGLIHYNILPPIVEYSNYILLFLFILILGVLITTLSTWLATWRFLRLKLDDLYYS
ncbi:cell division protein FtsX [Apibacter adventoris]|uniref:Cell division protein FtsX n=1 Tax=Apibacter adventoris TaxID=1679466 RepID=A0A2S8A7B6_9FLAO|nr:permease-like cell division protein FtsX [Apibacter adventoris]PQL90430.1 cell division protein FtsX [Apibacter adventoris]